LIWEGEDTYMRMVEHASKFLEEILELEEHGIAIHGKQLDVNILVGGDLKFMNEAWGTCGCSATQPCFWCYVKVRNTCDCD
jgi:hypothetical protein